MDFLFLPKVEDAGKRERAFTFKAYSIPTPKKIGFQRAGFYYIGKNAAHIERLVHMFSRGYASEGMDNVKAEMLRSLGQEKNVIPEVIICEARFDHASIRKFGKFLKDHPVLSAVPFIVDGSGLTDNELLQFKASARPDEILFLQNCNEKQLRDKVKFITRFKAAVPHTVSMKIEESLPQPKKLGHFFKRCFDVFVSGLALLVLSPIFALIALAIRLESKGPVFYIAKRAGRGYKIFNFYKFRTMEVGADKNIAAVAHLNQYDAAAAGPMFLKISNDPRITKIGKFLRNTSLDELPQFINVFLGDMSLVGNRPLPLYEAKTLTTNDYAARFMAPAGITGLWQIKKRGNKDMSVEERINIDIDYATKYNFLTDLRIIATTPFTLIQKENV